MDRSKIKEVHVVFKTHLDVGYTDLAANVMENYVRNYIPNSIRMAQTLNTGADKKFVWTVGSYLIDYYLSHKTGEEKALLEDAIRRGDISWHGLACTTHTELMDEDLLNFNLSISNELDARYGRKTIAAKMTDVPGHTRALVSCMADHGIRYIHFGVNGSSMVPAVPDTFVWKCDDKKVIVQYSGGYGTPCHVEGSDSVLEFAHTGDNMGPQSPEAILTQLEQLQKKYPNARVFASTLDAYAASILPLMDTLPVVDEEIGDTWIHGVATDPLKVARYRTLVGLKNKWKQEGRLTPETEGYHEFMLNLVMVTEHTWGMDCKMHLADFTHWSKKEFQAARAADKTKIEYLTNRAAVIQQWIREKMEKTGQPFDGSYSKFESSHEEQRQYLCKAVAALPQALQEEAGTALAAMERYAPAGFESARQIPPTEPVTLGPWTVSIGINGEIASLVRGNRDWIGGGAAGRLCYTTFSAKDCLDNYYAYNRDFVENQCWSESDFSKPALEDVPGLEHRDYYFYVTSIKAEGTRLLVSLAGNNKAVREYGCPAKATIEYNFGETITCRLKWTDKDANRTPEALWFDMNFDVENPSRWMMQKVSHLVSPLDVVKCGNRRQHCTEAMIYEGADGKITVRNIHSPLTSMGGHWLYGDYRPLPDMSEGFSYCLYDNKWGTNFKMWFEEDCTFDYEITVEDK